MNQAFAAANRYNQGLASGAYEETEQLAAEYERILDFGNGIMGFLQIPKIGIKLPIYHGVDAEVLEKGIGHMPTSAFPIGGEGNHTVLTGHTGLPSARLFTDLTEVEEGDSFEVVVGSASTQYRVDQIKVVLPNETEDLMPVIGEDYCTLVTCTPYGVNSHRLLVRGRRMETVSIPQQMEQVTLPDEQTMWRWWMLLPIVPIMIWAVKRERRKNE